VIEVHYISHDLATDLTGAERRTDRMNAPISAPPEAPG